MVTLGVDAHKSVHQALALDATGTVLGRWRGANTADAWQRVLAWAQTFPGPRRWGIAGAWNYGRGLAHYLVGSGATGYAVNPRWTAEQRRRARKPGKRDRRAAHAGARLVRAEGTSLPQLTVEDAARVLDLLVTERETARSAATRLRNQLHQQVLQRDPTYAPQLPRLTTEAGLQAVARSALAQPTPLQQQRSAALRRLVQRLRLTVAQAATLATAIGTHVEAR